MRLDNKQNRALESKVIGYAKMIGKGDVEISEFLGYSTATIRRRMNDLDEHSPALSIAIKVKESE